MNRKKNNKGFSLVELIVVVLIIGILGVSLAPQVMKWVGRAKESSDVNNRANIETAVATAYAEYVATNSKPGFAITITVKANTGSNKDGIAVEAGSNNDTFEAAFKNMLDEVINKPVSPGNSDTAYTVTINVDGVITVTGGAMPTP